MKIMKYKKKPVVIEAIQWTGRNLNEIRQFAGKNIDANVTLNTIYRPGGNLKSDSNIQLYVRTIEGNMNAEIGDYIIKGVKGEFYPCKEDIFLETYEEVG